jgi:hypothetical protein
MTAEPVTYIVWSEHLDGEHEGVEVVAYSAFGAVLFAIAMFADDSEAGAEQGYILPFQGETWFAKSPAGVVLAFKQRDELNTIFERVPA